MSLCDNAECINTNGSFVCECHPGYVSYGSNNNCIGKLINLRISVL